MNSVLFQNGKRYAKKTYILEQDFERLIVDNAKSLFGDRTLVLDVKRKIDTQSLGGTIPDFYLFDFKDPQNPEFYIVEVELAKHPFFGHIFPQITKFFGFYRNPLSYNSLIEKLHTTITSDEELMSQLEGFIGNSEIYKFLSDTISNSQNILLVIDDVKEQLADAMQIYHETWGKMVKVIYIQEYEASDGTTILDMSPDFQDIDSIDIVDSGETLNEVTAYSEEFHLDGKPDEIGQLYTALRSQLTTRIPEVIFNPKRYYISLRVEKNFAFLQVRNKKINLIAMENEAVLRGRLSNHEVQSLAESVQNFYNGDCARIILEDQDYLNDIVDLLVDIQG